MLDMKLIREEPERIREAMVKRHLNPAPVEKIILLDEQRRQLIQDVEAVSYTHLDVYKRQEQRRRGHTSKGATIHRNGVFWGNQHLSLIHIFFKGVTTKKPRTLEIARGWITDFR